MNPSRSSATTLLYLVRHGATDSNVSRPYVLQGRSVDKPLNEIGRKQAKAVGAFLSTERLAGVYSSSMHRAAETGLQVAKHHGLVVEQFDDLCECDVGAWESMDWDSIMREHPQEYGAFMENPAENPYLGGESYGDVLNRARPVVADLLERHVGEAIAVVAHNVVNRVLLADFLGLEPRKAKDLHQSNACVNVIRRRDGTTSLVTLNSYFHLDESLR